MQKRKNTSALIIAALLLLLTAGTWAAIQHYKAQPVVEHKIRISDTLFKKHVYDKQLIKTLQSLCYKYDTLKTSYTIKGSINMIDKADTNDRMNNVGFIYCKNRNDFYYKMGTSEIVNAYGLYIAIDNRTRCMIVSAQKPIDDPQGTKMLGNIAQALRSEAYNLVGKKSGAEETLSLINEHHVACKQYSVSFDTLNLKISRIYSRLTNLNNPLRKDNEKVIDMRIEQWDSQVNLGEFISARSVVIKSGGKWRGVDRYAGYKIINMQ